MRFLKSPFVWVILVIGAVVGVVVWRGKEKEAKVEPVQVVAVTRGNIELSIQSTGTVKPQNRLEIKPPLAGRAEAVLVKEGKAVKQGEILAWMSSSERAALLDAARAKGTNELAYWQDVYKPTPLTAPLDGTIIACTLLPGQSVMASDTAFVMSDRLIVQADLDETDLGKVSLGQKVDITLDGYPDRKLAGVVDEIAFEAVTVNNVTTYKVDLTIADVPAFVRSGMTASAVFRLAEKKDVLLLPADMIRQAKGKARVQLADEAGSTNGAVVEVTTGLSDGKNTEIVSGIEEGARVARKAYQPAEEEKRMRILPKMPARR